MATKSKKLAMHDYRHMSTHELLVALKMHRGDSNFSQDREDALLKEIGKKLNLDINLYRDELASRKFGR